MDESLLIFADGGNAVAPLRNFVKMALAFALNLSTVTTVVAFAGSDFATLGDYSNGILYGAYCLSALFLGAPIIDCLGIKRALVCGLSLYCIYQSFFLVAALSDGESTANGNGGRSALDSLILAGAALGGTASGFLWPSQGSFFSISARRYAKAQRKLRAHRDNANGSNGSVDAIEWEEDLAQATGLFGGIFAAIFLCCEVACNLISFGLKSTGSSGTQSTYATFTGLAVLSVIGANKNNEVKKHLCEAFTKKEKNTIYFCLDLSQT